MLNKKQTKRRWFIMHVNAPIRTLRRFITELERAHTLVRLDDPKKRQQSFEVLISPKEFRKVQDAENTQKILISYELKNPNV